MMHNVAEPAGASASASVSPRVLGFGPSISSWCAPPRRLGAGALEERPREVTGWQNFGRVAKLSLPSAARPLCLARFRSGLLLRRLRPPCRSLRWWPRAQQRARPRRRGRSEQEGPTHRTADEGIGLRSRTSASLGQASSEVAPSLFVGSGTPFQMRAPGPAFFWPPVHSHRPQAHRHPERGVLPRAAEGQAGLVRRGVPMLCCTM